MHASRSFLEFTPIRPALCTKAELARGRKLVLFCGSGGRSPLAAKTLKEIGYTMWPHVGSGFGAWQKANGPTS